MRKKQVCILLLVTTIFLWSCKKQQQREEVTPGPTPIEYYPDGSHKFLKELKASEADKIAYDSNAKNFTISLPANYSADEINLSLSMYGGIKLLDSTESTTESTVIKFPYKGSEPLMFRLRATDGKEMAYQVYVNAPGKPNVQLLNNDIPLNFGPFVLPLKIISGVGTTPSAPGYSAPSVRLVDPKTGWVTQGSFQNNRIYAYIQDTGKVLSSDGLTLEINFGDSKTVVFDNLKFKRGLPKANLRGYDNILFPKTDSIWVFGGYFSPNEKYTAQYSSDVVDQPVSIEMKYVDSESIACSLPANIAAGSYLVTFYEGVNVMGKSSVYFSENKTHSIETIWKGGVQLALSRNTEKLSFKKGDIFYAKPWPPKYALGGSTTFYEKDLPDLRMKNGVMFMDLKPQLAIVSWAVAGLSFSVGKYILPENLPAGSYEASLVFPDKQESKPYWSKITVR